MNVPVVAVTGASGFIGWHVMCALESRGIPAVALSRDTEWSLATADEPKVLVHCAGVNRASHVAIADGNLDAAHRAASLLRSSSAWGTVIFVNSTQADGTSVYGVAKSGSADILAAVCDELSIRFVNLIVPGVFGEGGRPNYNSFVSTFAHLVAAGDFPEVTDDRDVELIHVADLADRILQLALQEDVSAGDLRVVGDSVRISRVAEILTEQKQTYQSGILPALSDPFETAMFNTLRACLFPNAYPLPLQVRADNRGHLIETLKAESGGQSFVSWTHPGITRGNHYHRRKFERFLVLSGTAEIQLRKLFSDEVHTFRVTGEIPAPIDMPTLHTHNITNIGDSELVTAFWTNEIFDPLHPDTYPLNVQRGTGA
jgi:UDP-2-acetamido-2,6-beta-L-arabino-hexul-4-ose reductase